MLSQQHSSAHWLACAEIGCSDRVSHVHAPNTRGISNVRQLSRLIHFSAAASIHEPCSVWKPARLSWCPSRAQESLWRMVRSARAAPLVNLGKAAAFAAAWGLGVYAEFGVPVFIGLLIFAMFTIGTSERWAADSSAYSVFNDGVSITGTMSAHQIDEQMRNGGHSMRAPSSQPESSFVQKALRGWGGGSTFARGLGSTEDVQVHVQVDEAELRRRRAAAADAAQVRAQAYAAHTDTRMSGS